MVGIHGIFDGGWHIPLAYGLFRAWKPHHYSMAPTLPQDMATFIDYCQRTWVGTAHAECWSSLSPFPLEPEWCNRPPSATEFQHSGGLAPRFQCNDVLQQPQHMDNGSSCNARKMSRTSLMLKWQSWWCVNHRSAKWRKYYEKLQTIIQKFGCYPTILDFLKCTSCLM